MADPVPDKVMRDALNATVIAAGWRTTIEEYIRAAAPVFAAWCEQERAADRQRIAELEAVIDRLWERIKGTDGGERVEITVHGDGRPDVIYKVPTWEATDDVS